jgi:hypothetical protein
VEDGSSSREANHRVDVRFLRPPALSFNRDRRYFAPVDELDVSEAVQQHDMSSANQGVIPALNWANSPVIGGDRKRDKRVCLQQFLYLVNHRHGPKQ